MRDGVAAMTNLVHCLDHVALCCLVAAPVWHQTPTRRAESWPEGTPALRRYAIMFMSLSLDSASIYRASDNIC